MVHFMRTSIIQRLRKLAVAIGFGLLSITAQAATPPNIVMIMVDDVSLAELLSPPGA